MDEDPLAYRLRHLSDDRLKAVFKAAAEHFGWGSPTAENRGVGIGGGIEKGGYVATCAEVRVNRRTRRVEVVRVVQAFECGAVVNPDHVRNQVEGCIVQGLGGALFESIDFENGRIRNASLSEYRVPRFSDVPEIEVIILDRKDLPSGTPSSTPAASASDPCRWCHTGFQRKQGITGNPKNNRVSRVSGGSSSPSRTHRSRSVNRRACRSSRC